MYSNTDSYCVSLHPTQMRLLRASNEMDANLLITGNTGTGKSHLAETVHASSKRAMHRFHKINLATLSENLMESELFGHERGAFTGADFRRVGKLEASQGSTVFLDEIGELPLRLQAKLLDFIQYKKITPVGSNKEIDLDVRIIAATNKNLKEEAEQGRFRADLFHRLNIFHVHLPELNLQKEKISFFIQAYLKQLNQKFPVKKITNFSAAASHALLHHDWPGNFRELEHAIEYAFALEESSAIQLESLPMELQLCGSNSDFEKNMPLFTVKTDEEGNGLLQIPLNLDFHETKENFEKLYLQQVLKYYRGQINLTSRSIGLNKVSLTEKIRKYGIDWKKIRQETLGPFLNESADRNEMMLEESA